MSICMSGHLMRVVYRKVLEVFWLRNWFFFSCCFYYTIDWSMDICFFLLSGKVIKLLKKNMNIDLLLIFYERRKIIKMVAELLRFFIKMLNFYFFFLLHTKISSSIDKRFIYRWDNRWSMISINNSFKSLEYFAYMYIVSPVAFELKCKVAGSS